MAIGKVLYGKTFSNTLFLHHLVVLIIYSIGLYYDGGMHYISMLVFVGEKPDPISYMMGKAKLTHLFIWNISQSFAVYLWYTQSVNCGALHFLYNVYKLGWYSEGSASTISGDLFLWDCEYFFLSHTLLDQTRCKEAI